MSLINFLNQIWGGGLEAVLGFIGILAAFPAIWWYLLPRYTAVCCHDGSKWMDLPGVWSAARGVAGNDLEQYTKQWLMQMLTGKPVTPVDARLPVNPVPRLHHVKWWGKDRGIFYVVGVRVINPALLEKVPGRLNCAPIRFEEADEYLSL